MLPEPLPYLFALADQYSVTIGVSLAAMWLLAVGCYIGEKVIDWRKRLVKVEGLSPNLVEKAPARI